MMGDTSMLGKEVLMNVAVFSATDRFEKGTRVKIVCLGRRMDGTRFFDLRHEPSDAVIREVAPEKVHLPSNMTQQRYQTDPKWAAKLP